MDAHLLLERAALQRVALADRAVLVDQELGHDEQRDALDVVRRAGPLGQHQMDDVLGKVVLAGRDEDLGSGDRIAAVGIFLGASLEEPEIGAAMRLGQVHRAGPFAGDHRRHIFLLELVAALDQQRCDRPGGQALVHFEAVVGRKDIFGDCGADDLRQPLPAIFLRAGQRRPSGFDELLIGFLEPRRSDDGAIVVALASDLVADAVERLKHLGGKAARFLEDRLDQVRRRIGKAGQVRIAADVEHVVEDEKGVAHRRGVGRHCLPPCQQRPIAG